jgi:hypothetical protein
MFPGSELGTRNPELMLIIDSHVHVGRNHERWDETRPMLEALGIDTAALAADPEAYDLESDATLPGDLSRPGGPFGLWYIGGNPFAGFQRGPAHLPRRPEDYQGIEWHCYFSGGFDYGGSDEVAAAEAAELLRSEAARPALEVLDALAAARLPVRITESLPITLALIERLPEATVIIPHMGLRSGGTTRIMHALADNPRVYFDTSVVEVNEALVRLVGAERVLFGSDAPMGDAAWSLRAVRSLDLPPADIAAILGENAQRLFGRR